MRPTVAVACLAGIGADASISNAGYRVGSNVVKSTGRPDSSVINTPDGYDVYNNVTTACSANNQVCGSKNWSSDSAWDYTMPCEGWICPNSGAATWWGVAKDTRPQPTLAPADIPKDANGNPVGPVGYNHYNLEDATIVPNWGVCGHADWNSPSTTWAYKACQDGLVCQDDGTSHGKQWSCLVPAVPWTEEDIVHMCSCCSNSCGYRLSTTCYDFSETTCGAQGNGFHYCNDTMYNADMCAEVKQNDTLNWWTGEMPERTAEWPEKIYAPYFDGGLYPILPLSEIAAQTGQKFFNMAFITSKDTTKCIPAWASAIDVRVGPNSWNMTTAANDYVYDEIAKLRKMGGDVAASFGGANGIELADCSACMNPADANDYSKLLEAYELVVSTLKSKVIDFDIEGNAYSSVNQPHWGLRFNAVKDLVKNHPDLRVGWTLPILPTGLTSDGLNFLTQLLASGAPMAYFNVMNMDYGAYEMCPIDKPGDMAKCEIAAIKALATQMFTACTSVSGCIDKYGWKTAADTYSILGSTPMLGMNDITIEFYWPEDAKVSLAEWQSNTPIKMVSGWSVHRDASCDLAYVDTKCSGQGKDGKPIQTEQYEFMNIFKAYTSQ